MTLATGARIGPYEILAPLGAGGMGEVYRARDAKLNRDVAIKVLPSLFSTDPERLARFQREAQVLASLNHQNIGHIYGLEDQSGVQALVLELVEGPTLADRIAHGPIPLEEAIPIALQMADALECAHEQGIIHRDLKPANIKLRPDGTVKVLDFGLAKALDPAATSSADAMNSPTLTARGTQLGIIVGTAAYMAPEQARGKAVDRRADIWAFGVVLYEMLSGRRAFVGDDVSITLAAVLKDDVDWKALPADLSASVVRVLRRCLEKDPKRRLSAIGEARFQLDEPGTIGSGDQTRPQIATTRRPVLAWTVATAAMATALASFLAWGPWRNTAPPLPVRVSGETGTGALLATATGTAVALSRDGQTVAFVATVQNRPLLFVRRLAQLQAVPLAGTEGATAPFFSPDGRWIGFFAGQSLKKIAVTGGAVMTVCPAVTGRGAWWGDDGTIVFQPTASAGAPLQRVSEGGGVPTAIGSLAADESTQRWPQMLPGGRGVLYTGGQGGAGWDDAAIMVQPIDGSTPKQLLRGGYMARYAASGHLLYLRQDTLFAAPFDLQRLTLTGDAVPVIEGVLAAANTGGAHFAVADSGLLVYVPGRGGTGDGRIHTMTASGATSVLRSASAEWYQPRYSNDGSKLALVIGNGAAADIWIHEPSRDLTKFTFDPGPDLSPVWTPDGERIAFGSARRQNGVPNLHWQRSNGTGPIERLATSDNPQLPNSFHPSGKFLAFTERGKATSTDIWILPLDGDEKNGWKPGTPTPFLQTPASESAPAFSPDGKWIAYMSGEGGAPEVYVRPFPSGNGKWKISSATGIHPRWSQVRNELFYLIVGPLNRVMVVRYRVEGQSFVAEAAKEWSPQEMQPTGQNSAYDLHPDGARIVMNKPTEDVAQPRDRAVYVFNFFEELRRLAPVRR